MKKVKSSTFFLFVFSLLVCSPSFPMACKINSLAINAAEMLELVCNLNVSISDVEFTGVEEIVIALSQLDSTLCSKLDQTSSITDSINQCTTISEATVISQPGDYCLSGDVAGLITITASNVCLDLDGHEVGSGIIINSGVDQVSIKNGAVVGGSPGISVGAGATSVTIERVTVKDATCGILFEGVSNSFVQHCTLTQNVTGLELSNSYNVVVRDTVAQENQHAGFDLINSSTNCIFECKALSTGQNNTVEFNNTVVGFVSANGYGNIFERCIANATHALSTTDSNSLIAGFALCGSEGCSKIIGCESANATASSEGVAVPYGILLEASLSSIQSITMCQVSGGLDSVFTVDWSPDSLYLAVGIESGTAADPDLHIYRFDRVASSLSKVDSTVVEADSDLVNSVKWSPDGLYLAVGITSGTAADPDLHIYRFDRSNGELKDKISVVVAADSDKVLTVDWSPDGLYLAVGIESGTSADPDLHIYRFDRVANSLSKVTSVVVQDNADLVNSVKWSPDGLYLAVGIESGTSADPDLHIYRFDRSNGELKDKISVVVAADSDQVLTVDWSPDGLYLAVGITSGMGADPDLHIYRFDRDTNTLTALLSVAVEDTSDIIHSVNWSHNGEYLAVGLFNIGLGLPDLFVYRFDRSSNSLEQRAVITVDNGLDQVYSAKWSPDGAYLAVGIRSFDSNEDLYIYSGLQFPSKNIIKDNTVYCNGHDVSATFTGVVGVGISGSSISNMIIGNTAYNNPPTPSTSSGRTGWVIGSNYQFVTNIFNPLFGQAPSDLQNISLDGCDAILSPEDAALVAKQIRYKVCQTIPSLIDQAFNILTADNACASTALTAAQTISVAGNYCFAQAINGSFLITQDDVTLDLNNYQLTGSITVDSNATHVNIMNGIIDATDQTDGILVSQGASHITIENIAIKKAGRGINFEGAHDSCVRNCSLVQNTTGLELDNAYKIRVKDTKALCNAHAGFCLLSSSTNCFEDCKALSTGENNDVIFENSVTGFVSANGYGNIFERCIANATQALSTTDSSSLIAGFALRGSESCSKIIGCEAANATASSDGVTVPYGVLLEGSLTELLTVTSINPGTIDVYSANWSADGQYLAVGGFIGGVGDDVWIYSFDRGAGVLNEVTSIDPGGATSTDYALAVHWSPDGQYLAVGGEISGSSNDVWIYSFDRGAGVLNEVTSIDPGGATGNTVRSVHWSPDGQYLAVGGSVSGSPANDVWIYSFDRGAGVLNEVTSIDPGGATDSDSVHSVNWSPDGQYLAVGGFISGSPANDVWIYSFDRGAGVLNEVTSIDPGGATGNIIRSVHWSPDGQYLAVGGFISGSPANDVWIYSFDRGAGVLNEVTSIDPGGATGNIVLEVHWSPDGQYLAVGGLIGGSPANDVWIYSFDRGAGVLNEVTSINPGGATDSDSVSSVNWSPDGRYLAVGGTINSDDVWIYSGIQFPSKNVIKDNTVYCNGHDVSATFTGAIGVGISGSSISNMIIGNTAYNNPPTPSTSSGRTGWVVGSNYHFVTNVFNSLFGNAPTALQNVSVDGCEPVAMPEDQALLAKQIRYKVCNDLTSFVENLTDGDICSVTAVNQAQTIAASGNYCVSESFTGDILIDVDNVTLDLNNYVVRGTVTINTSKNYIVIKNGTVDAQNGYHGILINTEARNVVIEHVLVKNAVLGVSCQGATKGLIQHCTLSQNTTGIALNTTQQYRVDSVVATGNSGAGIELVGSSYNTITNSKAIGTGQNNTAVEDNRVFGFASVDGMGNIFERCIANATQALSTTDSNSLIAGFALRGSEECSKIIGCEAANAIASSDGVTVPYGILLEPTFDSLVTVSGFFGMDGEVQALDWSPDGQYLIAGGFGFTGIGDHFQLLSYDRVSNSFTALATVPITTGTVRSVAWSPDGNYVALSGSNITDDSAKQLRVYSFERVTNALTQIAGFFDDGETIRNVSWNSDGRYLAISGESITSELGEQLQIFELDKINNTMQAVASAFSTNAIYGLKWGPGDYIAVGGLSLSQELGEDLQILQFDRSGPSLTAVAAALGTADSIFAVSWSADGNFVAAGGSSGSNNILKIVQFDAQTPNAQFITEGLGMSGTIQHIDWSPGLDFISVGGGGLTGNEFQVVQFDRNSSSLQEIDAALGTAGTVQGTRWSPDGRFIAVGGGGLTGGIEEELQIFTGFNFPSKNVIKDNTVYCNGHDVSATFTGAVGVGISGSSISNMIIGNTSYNNPPTRSTGSGQTSSNFFVSSNYQFVTNVFNQLFGQAPSDLQNISLDGCVPIAMPDDIALIEKQTFAKNCDVQTKVDYVQLLLQSLIDNLPGA